jgi:hypothetical protein|tara:strand:+ start:207 stop:542 length:336 start_codon:yes stop_codon:yes gene_type:complete
MLDLNPDQIEKDFSQNAVLQMEFALIEFKLDMQALLYTNFHLYRPISIWLDPDIGDDEFFLLRYPIIVSVDHNIYVVSQLDHYPVVSLELLLHSVELKIVGHIICKGSRRF